MSLMSNWSSTITSLAAFLSVRIVAGTILLSRTPWEKAAVAVEVFTSTVAKSDARSAGVRSRRFEGCGDPCMLGLSEFVCTVEYVDLKEHLELSLSVRVVEPFRLWEPMVFPLHGMIET